MSGARVPEYQRIRKRGLDQHGAERFGIDSFLPQLQKKRVTERVNTTHDALRQYRGCFDDE